jgi:hypothetical protein
MEAKHFQAHVFVWIIPPTSETLSLSLLSFASRPIEEMNPFRSLTLCMVYIYNLQTCDRILEIETAIDGLRSKKPALGEECRLKQRDAHEGLLKGLLRQADYEALVIEAKGWLQSESAKVDECVTEQQGYLREERRRLCAGPAAFKQGRHDKNPLIEACLAFDIAKVEALVTARQDEGKGPEDILDGVELDVALKTGMPRLVATLLQPDSCATFASAEVLKDSTTNPILGICHRGQLDVLLTVVERLERLAQQLHPSSSVSTY